MLLVSVLSSQPDRVPAAPVAAVPPAPAITRQAHLEFSIGSVALAPGIALERVELGCDQVRIEPDAVACPRAVLRIGASPCGPIRATGSWRWSPATGALRVDTGDIALFGGRVRLALSGGPRERRLSAHLADVEIEQLAGALGPFVPLLLDYEVSGGRLDANLDCVLGHAAVEACRVSAAVEQLKAGGTQVAEDLDARFDVDYASTAAADAFSFSAVLQAGAVYVEPGFSIRGFRPGFLLEVGDRPVSFMLDLERGAQLVLRRIALSHPGTGELTLEGRLSVAPDFVLSRVEARLRSDDLARLYAVYLQPLLLGSVLGSLEIAGSLDLGLRGADGEINVVTTRFRDVHLEDEQGRFALFGLEGGLELHDGPQPRESQIAWQRAAFYRVGLGPGRIDLSSENRGLKAVSWQDLAVFDGGFKMETLEIDRFGAADMSIVASGRLTPISLSELTAALGWPPLAGRLSGVIPGIRLTRDLLEVDGDLEVQVFGGDIAVRNLRVTDPFGVVPSLYADVEADGLSLAELTSTFSFGNIEGRLKGTIDDLRLEAWQPVYFDAFFETPEDDDTPHRISRQAVDNLGRLGAGTGSVLTQGLLGFIPSYSYGRLGIGCRLDGGFCEMSGVERGAGGEYYILTRGGLLPPWIDIKATGRRIAWSTLVDGIRQIARGEWEFEFGGRRD